MGLWDGGEAVAAEREREAAPIVLVRAQDVPDGRMPDGAARVVAKLLGAGCEVRSTYAAALVPGVRRKVDGEFRKVTAMRESVAVRFRAPAGRGWLTWERNDGGSWGSGSRWLHCGERVTTFAMQRSAKMEVSAYTLAEVIADLRDGSCSAPESAEIEIPKPKIAPGRANLALMPWLRDRWAATGTPTSELYPCRCGEPVWQPGRFCGPPRNGPSCPCWWRSGGLEFMPATCCGLRRLL